ncbi:serine hydrolase [Luteimonas sp. M1R5S18]|uniref:Serine hydrolase n=1 Tax=Luteimonas rhizosphaericola TaxID=3042024 RepID=A0ABT6JI57_9GAMM|nr:serine hydrolase domain-containing protein [Luteimonas rhizosphaericola]MDH5830365.1 serine hydrolase [Luteimonas rhizosphaericola]
MKANLHRPRRARLGRALLVGMLSAITLSSTAQTPLAWNRDASTGADVTPAPITPATPSDRPVPLPADVQRLPLADGFDVRVFEAMAQDLVANQRVPGLAMAIVHDGKVLSARGYGITDVSHAQPVDAHTVFRLASLSKSFAGTVTGMLVSEGALRWDSRVADFMPSLSFADPAAAQRLTVADVLSHRVGLRHHTYDRDIEANADYHNLVQRFAAAPMACSPGQCYGYQNVAFSLVGDVVFAASGQFYSEAVTRRIFKPLGMNDASLGLDGITASARWAKPHVRAGGGWKSLMPKPTYYRLAPAAGVNASISDMAQWLLAQSGRRPEVLPAPLLATLQSPIVGTPGEIRGASWRRERLNAAGYGLGWRIYDYSGHRLVFHGGAVQGYRGLMAMLPERDLGVVVLWNSDSSLPSGLLPTILDRAIGLPSHRWLDVDPDLESLYASDEGATPSSAGGPQSGAAAARPQ